MMVRLRFLSFIWYLIRFMMFWGAIFFVLVPRGKGESYFFDKYFFAQNDIKPPDLQKTANPPNASQRPPNTSQRLPTPPNTSQHPSNLARILGIFFFEGVLYPLLEGVPGWGPGSKVKQKNSGGNLGKMY